jgi:formylglycine-generating enzyme required for sulfatase activity
MLAPNTLIQNRYRIVRHIAGGGMGSVYEATDERLDHTVALKQLVLTDVQAQQAFEREAKILAPLRHAVLPNVSDYFSDPAGRFLVMQYIPGDDLGAQLARRGQPFPVEQVLEWADQLLRGLDYLHQRGIIHRDIKPQNLKLTDEGDIILLDFGIAKNSTKGSVMAATPGFAPLEQMQGQGTDARSDLYALGATLYCLLTDSSPESCITRLVAESRRQPDPVHPLHALNPQVAPPVSAVIMQAMALHPDERPAGAAAMRQMLAAARKPQPAVVTRTVPVPIPPAPAQSPQLIETVPIGTTHQVIELIEIPAGPFLMGSRDEDPLADDDEKPQNTVELPTYYIGKTEVTNAQFRPFVEGDGYDNPDYWTDAGWEWREAEGITQPAFWDDANWNGDQQPVVGISWYEAVAYTRWLSAQTDHDFRLPTEAEWEKAARGTEGLIWPWGNAWEEGRANTEEADIGRTTPVGSYPEGASPYGVLDMAGNVWEWTATKGRKDYPYTLEDEWNDAYLADYSTRVIRGGAWNWEQQYVRGADRIYDIYPRYRYDYYGLRLARYSPLPGSNE